MNLPKLTSIAFAALLGVSAQAQIITNYGQVVYPDSAWNGNWEGSGQAINNSFPWAAQTFTAPTAGPIYAYNVQFNVQNGATPSFTTAIYEWNNSTSTLGSLLSDTTATFDFTSNSGFNIYGANVVTNPGIGTVSLNVGAMYAIVIRRTDGGTSGIVQTGITNDAAEGTPYDGGTAFRSTNGTTFAAFPGGISDYAFWLSFDPNSLSPVPEPAVNGAIIGATLVAGLITWRRRNNKSAAPVAAA
jgi:hypothetical protein